MAVSGVSCQPISSERNLKMNILKKIGGTAIVIVSAAIIFSLAYVLRDTDSDSSAIFAVVEADDSGDASASVCGHEYESATGDVCIKCGYVYVPEINSFSQTMYSVKDNCPVRSTYYQGDNVTQYLNEGEAIEITGSLINALDHLWYITEDGCYVYGDNLISK